MVRKRSRGFAAMDEDQQRQIASKGGKAAHERGTAHEFTSAEARPTVEYRSEMARTVSVQNGSLAAQLLPALYINIHVLRIQFDTVTDAFGHLGRSERGQHARRRQREPPRVVVEDAGGQSLQHCSPGPLCRVSFGAVMRSRNALYRHHGPGPLRGKWKLSSVTDNETS